MDTINSGDTSWLLISSALVLMMTPALAFFYGGMVRKKVTIQPETLKVYFTVKVVRGDRLSGDQQRPLGSSTRVG